MTSPLTIRIPDPRPPLTFAERVEENERILRATGVNLLQDCPAAFDLEVVNAITFPHPSLVEAYQSGCAEPWISNLVTSLLIASNRRTVLETGGFTGQTSAWLALALARMGGGSLTVAELEPDRIRAVNARLHGLGDALPDSVSWRVAEGDVLQFLPTLENESIGFAWVDDCHEKPHVAREIELLYPKMERGGIITFHDVYGSCDLQEVVRSFGGYAVNLPRFGPAGGIGILQKP